MKIDDFSRWVRERQQDVEHALERWVSDESPAGIGSVMRYAVLDGGKRLRPLLVMAAAEAVAGDAAAALRAAVAVELIHAYSLVHDDMPCMDNDVLRRGKPTVHVKYGEAQAMLAGDAMQALAFDVLTPDEGMSPLLMSTLVRLLARASGHDGMAGGQAIDLASVGRQLDEQSLRDMHRRKTGVLLHASVMMGAACGPADATALAARLVALLARAAGHAGMAGGQAIDLASVGMRLDEVALRDMHRRKTGVLLQASVMMGAACGDATPEALAALSEYGAAIGLAFQVVDDVLDVTQASEVLGKTAGKDVDQNKPTYVSLLGLDAARRYAHSLRDQAHAALAHSGLRQAAYLACLADKIVERDN